MQQPSDPFDIEWLNQTAWNVAPSAPEIVQAEPQPEPEPEPIPVPDPENLTTFEHINSIAGAVHTLSMNLEGLYEQMHMERAERARMQIEMKQFVIEELSALRKEKSLAETKSKTLYLNKDLETTTTKSTGPKLGESVQLNTNDIAAMMENWGTSTTSVKYSNKQPSNLPTFMWGDKSRIDDPEEFMDKFTQVCKISQVNPNMYPEYLYMSFERGVLNWYKSIPYNVIGWTEVKKLFLQKYKRRDMDTFLFMELEKLKVTSSGVQDYALKFVDLALKLHLNLIDTHVVNDFLKGLPQEIVVKLQDADLQRQLRNESQPSVEDLARLAVTIETNLEKNRFGSIRQQQFRETRFHNNQQPLQLVTQQRPMERPVAAAVEEKKEESACTICNRLGHATKNCWIDPVTKKIDINKIVCSRCKTKGHLSRDCSKPRILARALKIEEDSDETQKTSTKG
jgi:hypothetical protein